MLTMKRPKRKTCPCCGVVFETTRKDKVYLDATHQKYHNNAVQNRKRDQQCRISKDHFDTFRIYQKLLGIEIEATYSKDFLKGKGANLTAFSGIDIIEGEQVEVLFGIAIIPNNNKITLKKIKHA